MTIPFPTDEWVKAFMQEVNNSPTYEQVARNWEGDFYFIIETGGVLEQPATLYVDLWHGKCRDAFYLPQPNGKTPAYLLSGTVQNWKKVMTKQLDPMQAMMTGQLKLKGNMAMIMKNVPAAKELVEACTRVPTLFPV